MRMSGGLAATVFLTDHLFAAKMKNPVRNTARIKAWFWNIIASGLPADDDIDRLRKHFLLNAIILVGMLFLFLLAVLAIFQDDYVLSIVDLAIFLFLAYLLHILRKTKNHQWVGFAGTVITGIFYLFLIVHGGPQKPTYLWSLTYPLIAYYLLGKRTGTIMAMALLGLACLCFALGGRSDFFPRYDINLVIRFIAVYLTLVLMSLIMEIVRGKVQNRLEASKSDLEDIFLKVQENSVELARANRQLQKEVDERKRIEQALRQSENFLDNVIESIQDGISVLDSDLTIRYTNRVMRAWYRQNLPLVGKKCHECYHNQSAPCPECPSLRCLQSGKTERATVPGLPGSPVEWIELYSFPIVDRETGEITGVVEFVRDITNRRQLEEQLAHAQKMEAVGTLAGGVAHDLNNILSGIVSYPELLLMDLPADSPLREPIETIQASGQKAATIVQDLLTLARRGVSIKEVVDLNAIVTAFLNSPECGKIVEFHPGIRIETDFQPDLLNIAGSPFHLSKTIMNLISNAAEAMPSAGVVALATRNVYLDRPLSAYEMIPQGEYVVLEVSDAGAGISPEDLHRIFEPFYTKKTMGRSGTGLGMAVVWGTMKDMGGYVDVRSKPGRGTRFRLYFPVTRKAPAQPRDSVSIEDYIGNEKVLVVDDVKEQRDIARAMLSKLGYEVATVPSGEAAVEFMAADRADLLVLDMVMEPGIDGLETYREILKTAPGLKAIIASGFSETERVKEAQTLGAGAYLRKPYTLEKIGLAVRTELDR